ncbi:phosphoheptose isomerase [Methylocaldum marinum]|uniref:Phosphoheptose isomerase n=1 Tax=Methylocaldum marinum TaxID=1432792 RepID=A0A286P454_9GAMM|nr:D-sedoheptulose 7-phosphate isomerase [Methylocaldum marinum]BBA32426.1 phosphoheptose isomerase [Methylocaldum marinum]
MGIVSAGGMVQSDIRSATEEHIAVFSSMEDVAPQIEALGERLVACIRSGGKVLFFGNGGSAADSQHLAAELVGRFVRERRGLPAIALTTDTSILTAVGNDYGFETIFARQIEALCGPQDIVVSISTSGNSPNVIAAIERAKEIGAFTAALTGKDGGRVKDMVDLCIRVPSSVTSRIQEAHIFIGHVLCDWVERSVVGDGDVRG